MSENKQLNELRDQVMEMQSAAYAFGEYSMEAVRIALDGVIYAIDELAATRTKPADGAAGAGEVKAMPALPEPAFVTTAEQLAFTVEQMHDYVESYATDQLARQQAPVGGSVDTPEFRALELAYAKAFYAWEDNPSAETGKLLGMARQSLIANITTWKDAQLARERHGGMHAAADYIDKKAEEYINENADAEHDTGATVWRYGGAGRDYYNSLVELAEELRAATPAPQAQGEPVARLADILEEDGEIHFDVKWIRPGQCQVGSMLYLGSAPQADEVRDAARYRWLRDPYNDAVGVVGQSSGEELDVSIDAFMRTTATDNQKGGE